MELTQITGEMYKASQRLEAASKALYKLGDEKARSEQIYRCRLAQEMLTLKSEGMSIGMIADVARGNVSDLLFQRDAAETKFKCAIESLGAIQTQLSALQSILKYQESA
jgi:hypothetical protein